MRMAGAVNFTYGANVPLAVNTNVAKVVALEARFMVAGVVLGASTGMPWIVPVVSTS